MTRRRSRIDAVILLYQSDLLEKNIKEIIKNEIMFEKKIDDFTMKLLVGVSKHREKIDGMIKEIAKNWTLERMAVIDRNILRVAIYEMLYEEDIPLKVSVDEAIEIAKIIGQKEDTPKFINGVLGKILINITD